MSALLNQARSRVPRIAEAAVDRARLTVVPRRATAAPRVPFVALVSVLLVGGVAGLLLFNTSMQQASFTATALEERAAVLDAREQSLEMELEMLRDPQRMALEAREMGMVPPSNPAFLRLSDGEVLGEPTPATALEAVRIAPLPTVKPRYLSPDPLIVQPPRKSRSGDGAASAGRADGEGTKKRNEQQRRQGGDR
jgi:hypothetical protein